MENIASTDKKAKLVFLSIDKDSAALQSFLSQHQLNDITFKNRDFRKAIRNFLDGKSKNNLLYSEIVPKTYIIKEGKVIYSEEGTIDSLRFSQKLNSLK